MDHSKTYGVQKVPATADLMAADRITFTRAHVSAVYDQIDRNIQAILNNKGIKDGKGYNAYFELAYQTDGARAVFMAIASNWPAVCDWCYEEESARHYFDA